VREGGALCCVLTLGVGAVVIGRVCTIGVGAGVLGSVDGLVVICTLGAGAGGFVFGTLVLAAATLGAVAVSGAGTCTLGTSRAVWSGCGVCGVAGVRISLSWASMALMGSPVWMKGSAKCGLLVTTWVISSMAAARRSCDDVFGMVTFVGKNSTVLDTRSPFVAVTKMV
jgi:hypothetical protein